MSNDAGTWWLNDITEIPESGIPDIYPDLGDYVLALRTFTAFRVLRHFRRVVMAVFLSSLFDA